MNNPYRSSTMLGGSLICAGAVLMVICSYFYFDDVSDKADTATLLLGLAVLGYSLWITGSVLLARARFSSGWAGLLCGLLLLPGLIALLTVIPTRSRQEIWQAANPGFTHLAQKRQYPNVKSLY